MATAFGARVRRATAGVVLGVRVGVMGYRFELFCSILSGPARQTQTKVVLSLKTAAGSFMS